MPDQEDFERVFLKEYPKVYRFALRLCQNADLADELTQQTFYKALTHIDRFRGECRLDVWLCQIAKHAFFDHKRKQRFDAPPTESLAATDPAPWEVVERREETRRIHQKLHQMEEPYKEVFSLRTFGELPYGEIARLFGKTESWARVTYYRAKLKLQELMKEDML